MGATNRDIDETRRAGGWCWALVGLFALGCGGGASGGEQGDAAAPPGGDASSEADGNVAPPGDGSLDADGNAAPPGDGSLDADGAAQPAVCVPGAPNVYFAQDYTGVTLANANSSGTNKRFVNWDIFGATSLLDNEPYLWEYKPPFTNIAMDDTHDSARRSLFFEVFDDDPSGSGTTRTQYSLHFKEGADMPVFHTRHRMFLSPDLAELQSFDGKINWVDLFETWTRHHDTWSGDGAGSSRISLYLNKDSAVGSPLYWELKSNYQQPAEVQYDPVWPTKTNKAVAPLFGKWFALDVMVVSGVGNNGKVRIVMTPDGGEATTLFEFNDTTVYYRDGVEYPELYRSSWQPYKFYFGDEILDWLRSRGKRAYAYYNDFCWLKD